MDTTVKEPHFVISESPRFLGRGVAAMASDPKKSRLNGKSLSSGELAKMYDFVDLDGSQPDCFRYLEEIHSAGKPANAEGYR